MMKLIENLSGETFVEFYDENKNITREMLQDGTMFFYDENENKTKIIFPDGGVSFYDENGRIIKRVNDEVENMKEIMKMVKTERGKCMEFNNSELQFYNENGKITKTIKSDGTVLSYEYGELNTVKAKHPDGSVELWVKIENK